MIEINGEQLAAISREMVRIQAQHYGKGATEAKSYVCDDFLFCVLKNGLTTVERTFIDRGDEQFVRDIRLRFQRHLEDTFVDAVQRISGHRVLTYHSQVLFDPDYLIEIFRLGEQTPGPSESS